MSEILTELHDHILIATFNRSDIHNAMSHTGMIDAIVGLCERVNQDDSIRVLVLTGAGKSFCAGGNIKEMLSKSNVFSGTPKQIEAAYKSGIQRIPVALWNLNKPVIAAVNGAAVGAGCDIAMMCDIRIASSKARFAESFVKLGIIPGDGGAWFLPRVIGQARANQMTLTGEMVDAQEALNWGMVSQVCAPEELMTEAINIAQKISANPPLAVTEAKKLLRQSANTSLPEMLDLSAAVQAQLHQTEDHMEALNAFVEKRTGLFQGK